MNNKIKSILGSVLVIAIAASMMTFGTQSYLSDSEKSENNILTAGQLDLKIDLNSTWYDANGVLLDEEISFPETDLTTEKFFNWSDIKPGDGGEMTISIHVYDNDALLNFSIYDIIDTEGENGVNDPEQEAGDEPNSQDGELDNYLMFRVWLDEGAISGFQGKDEDPFEGDNKYQEIFEDAAGATSDGETLFFDWTLLNAINEEGEEWDFYAELGVVLEACTTYYIGIEWYLPWETGNLIQGDSWGATLEFVVEQYRNNPRVPQPD